MTDRVRLYTADEFERFVVLPENAEKALELIRGEIVEKPMPTEEHGNIVDNASLPIRLHLKQNRLGRGGPEIRYHAPDDPHTTLMPDWSFRLGIVEPPISDGAVQGMPDFALEVQSPGDRLAALREKARICLRHGVKLVWLTLPRQRVVEVYWADGSEEVYTVEDTLTFGDLLPGLQIPVRDLFAF
ncbi:MAG: Uma2 family endonuclease [Anaerolineae bacterium]|nr:Uma2 family endonuclease [Anaerolineae bacterium]